MSYPQPINQFNRLVHTSGPDVIGTYARGSRWNNIHNGQNYDSKNCTAASGAILIDANTGGRITSTPPRIRNAQNDWDGGIGWDDVNIAWSRLYPGNSLVLPQAHSWADVIASLRQNRAVGIQYGYAQVPYSYQCQKGGTFAHAGVLAGYRPSDGRVLYYDPLCTHASWVPQSVVRAGCEALAREQRGTIGRLFVALTKPMPPPYIPAVTYKYGGEPRFRGRYLARRDDVPIRNRPDPTATQVATLGHRQDFAARQSTAEGRWLGTADGDKWVYRDVMWYAGAMTGSETIR